MCMMAITFLNLIGIPMEIAFLDGSSGLAWEGFNVFSDTLFLIDVALNFRMGIIRDDCEVRAARLYLQTRSGGSTSSRCFLLLHRRPSWISSGSASAT